MSSKAKSSFGKKMFVFLTLAFSAGFLLYFLFSNNGVETIGKILSTLQLGWFILALAAAGACWLLEAATLHIICRHLHKNWNFQQSFTVGMTGLLYSAITPSATGGQPMQIYTMHSMGMETGVACSVAVVKTIVYQIVMVFYALIMVIAKLHYFQTNVSNFSFITVLGLFANSIFIATVFLFMISEKLTDRILRAVIHLLHKVKLCRHPEERYQKIHNELQLFHDATKIMGNSMELYLSAAGLTLAQITLNSLIPYFIYRSFNLRGAHVTTMIAAQVFVAMVSAFVPLPGSTGGAESCFYLFFGPYFKSSIWPAVLLWRIITYYFNILFGGIFAYFGNRYFKRSTQKKLEK
jgi:uncharacterized protein (TIRG00374 family)